MLTNSLYLSIEVDSLDNRENNSNRSLLSSCSTKHEKP